MVSDPRGPQQRQGIEHMMTIPGMDNMISVQHMQLSDPTHTGLPTLHFSSSAGLTAGNMFLVNLDESNRRPSVSAQQGQGQVCHY